MIRIAIAEKEKGYVYYQRRVVITKIQRVARPEGGGIQYLKHWYEVQDGTGPIELLPQCVGDILFNGIKVQEPTYSGCEKEVDKWEDKDSIYTRISLYPAD